MIINDVSSRPLLLNASPPETQPGQNNQPGFIDYLKGALGEVDALQKEAAANAEKLALGDESYLHNTIISYEKATLALQLTIEVRNRMVEAYQDIMRMQM
ncbi:Flagellar hook-basal body complex protein FliE [Syntrophomonas zehnderi OL-4]|uniref:Flagellar hook-basal body complex protein FliE n=1 Tax=Syntrophomonas zehnderi OL-4 TaxID=690567 RepID=A0A0E4C8R6_9FIRM|nr:flagellar hook-basal body complex protein FliE [Syntrophomonas zehnderi]CFX64580.1 Flagellar hook-basal body complex protein FliE [Syntrophomonas zehnderi OL-4]